MNSGESFLESLHQKYNRREYLHTDPVELLHPYSDPRDREIAGLIAACLAYGRVALIRKNVSRVLDAMGESPARFLRVSPPEIISNTFSGFCHRFCREEHLAALLTAVKILVEQYGSLENAFAQGIRPDHETVLPGLEAFYARMRQTGVKDAGHLLPDPEKRSACKRWNLYLRWMVRKDEVDPGGWTCAAPRQLVVPLDVHMGRVCRKLGLTSRRQMDMKTALEVTRAFARIAPNDPVRYDFALTRASMENPALFQD